jgi:hypothetical protein
MSGVEGRARRLWLSRELSRRLSLRDHCTPTDTATSGRTHQDRSARLRSAGRALRAGELKAIWCPRRPTRRRAISGARDDAVNLLLKARQQLKASCCARIAAMQARRPGPGCMNAGSRGSASNTRQTKYCQWHEVMRGAQTTRTPCLRHESDHINVARKLGEEGIGGGGPCEGLAGLGVLSDKVIDLADQFLDRGEDRRVPNHLELPRWKSGLSTRSFRWLSPASPL